MEYEPVVLATGCASGIGRHLARSLMRRGYRGLFADVNQAGLRSLVGEPGWVRERAVLHSFDVREPAEWEAAVAHVIERFGRVDLLLNVAGYLRPGWVHESESEQIGLHLDVNAKGMMLGTQIVSRRMIEQGAGHIVNFGSMAAVAPVPGIALYAASKFAVRGFSLAVARELRPHGVYVTLICPDAVQSPMLDVQLDYVEAALTFSGPRTLTPDDVERVLFDRVLTRRPLEVLFPATRGWLARLSNAVPSLAAVLMPRLSRRGEARQTALKRQRDAQRG